MNIILPTSWNDVLEQKSRLIIKQIGDLHAWGLATNAEPSVVEKMTEPFYRVLRSIYNEDYPLAKASEESDLLFHYKGSAVDHHNPRLSLLAGIFHNVRRQVGSVAYALSNITNRAALPKDVDLGLSGFAKGSLFVGFSLPSPLDFNEDGQASVLGENDPLYVATKQAIRTIGVVCRMIEDRADSSEFDREFPDSKVRDVAISAVKSLSPSGRAGISEVTITGREISSRQPKKLNSETRRTAKSLLDRPVNSNESTIFIGTIREIDLDVERFEIRHLAGSGVEDIRCRYPAELENLAKELLDKRVRVSGKIERGADGTPRLLDVDSLEAAD